ncbi:MAG TPA: hypothetical protein VG963_33215 [Polyangiaceae bacterium]|nr:hypothetical protein [Polyangiaceae bacterium]
MERKPIVATHGALLALAVALGIRLPAAADGRPIPSSEWNEATQLTLAQVMVGEADWSEPDHVAIAFVLARRWQQYRDKRGHISFRRYMQLYSSAMKVETERARWVRALPWGELSGRHAGSWAAVRKLVKAWGLGEVEDPCPEALHWGGTTDRPRPYWQAIRCGSTRNTFYMHRPLPAQRLRAYRRESRAVWTSAAPVSPAGERTLTSVK